MLIEHLRTHIRCSFQFFLRPQEVHSSWWKLVFNNQCSVPEKNWTYYLTSLYYPAITIWHHYILTLWCHYVMTLLPYFMTSVPYDVITLHHGIIILRSLYHTFSWHCVMISLLYFCYIMTLIYYIMMLFDEIIPLHYDVITLRYHNTIWVQIWCLRVFTFLLLNCQFLSLKVLI